MTKASDIKKGNVVEINNRLYAVKQIEVNSPSARGAATLYKMRFAEVPGGQKFEQTFKGDDQLTEVALFNRPVQLLFKEDQQFTFMDNEDYSQHLVDASMIEDQIPWLIDGLEGMIGLFVNEQMIGLQLPQAVIMEVIETAPALKGATATSSAKPATLTTGVTVNVPDYIESGEMIKVNTETKKFMSRA